MEEWLKSLPQVSLPLYVVGPLLPPGYGRPSVENSASEQCQEERDVQVFLKDMQANYGEKSVVFVGFLSPLDECPKYLLLLFQISFGTIIWPTEPGYIDEVIQALIDQKVPFVSFFLPYSFVGNCIYFRFKSDTLPRISLGSTVRGTCEQCKILRLRISDKMGTTAIYLVPPGMALGSPLNSC
jgi:hypothetical protein